MKISETMAKALNEQVTREFESAYLYLSMSLCFDAANLKGAAHWMRVQFGEETGHAMKLLGYISERGGSAELDAIAKPQAEWCCPLTAFEAALEHERFITGCIYDLVKQAQAEGDLATVNFLQWYVAEQVEEEASADEVVQMLKMAGDSPGPLMMVDRHLASRQG